MSEETSEEMAREATEEKIRAKTRQLCTFYLERHFFGVPVGEVQEVIRYLDLTWVPLVSEVVRGVINLRGQIVTAIELRRCLGMPERPAGQLPMNVVIRTGDGAVSLLVDEIGDVLDVEPETMEKPPETLQGPIREMVRGVYKLAGALLLELDIQRAIADIGKESAQAASA
ncbi:MAG: chemotaxis protein CheW [Terriglobales bacterium]